MAQVIQENFDYLPVASLPDATAEWDPQKHQLLRLDGCPGKRLQRLRVVFQKDNGPISQPRFVHYCLGDGCCRHGREEALGAMIGAYTTFFSSMQVPPLYRWKHAPEANDFVRDGHTLHGILTRALEIIPQVKCETDKVMNALEEWIQAARGVGFEDDGDKARANDLDDLSRHVGSLLDKETSFAEQNAKRLNLVRQTFGRASFSTAVHAVDLLIRPLEVPINKCLRRSAVLRALRFQDFKAGVGDTAEELQQYEQAIWLEWSSGQMGLSVARELMAQLKSQELAGLASSAASTSRADFLQTCFQLLLFVMTDIWRRLTLATDCFPFKMFSLIHCSVEEFKCKRTEFRKVHATCAHCVDAGFTGPLLQSVDMSQHTGEALAGRVGSLQQLLIDASIYTPIGTELVENTHGQQQSMFTRFRSKAKAPEAAAELSLLHSLQVEHANLSSVVANESLPSRARCAQMLRSLGRRGKTYDVKKPFLRVKRAAAKTRRRINGWNVFLREQIGHKSKKDPKV